MGLADVETNRLLSPELQVMVENIIKGGLRASLANVLVQHTQKVAEREIKRHVLVQHTQKVAEREIKRHVVMQMLREIKGKKAFTEQHPCWGDW